MHHRRLQFNPRSTAGLNPIRCVCHVKQKRVFGDCAYCVFVFRPENKCASTDHKRAFINRKKRLWTHIVSGLQDPVVAIKLHLHQISNFFKKILMQCFPVSRKIILQYNLSTIVSGFIYYKSFVSSQHDASTHLYCIFLTKANVYFATCINRLQHSHHSCQYGT